MLLTGINEIQIILISLTDIALKEDLDQDAADLAEISHQTADLFGLWDYSFLPSSAEFQQLLGQYRAKY